MVTVDLQTDLLGIFTPGEVNTISGVFKRMDIAEQEIEAAQKRHPEKADLLWECFAIRKPPSLLDGKADVMYHAHCRELLERVVAGEDVAAPTNAELIAAFSVVSLATPLTDAATFAYVQLFQVSSMTYRQIWLKSWTRSPTAWTWPRVKAYGTRQAC